MLGAASEVPVDGAQRLRHLCVALLFMCICICMSVLYMFVLNKGIINANSNHTTNKQR